MLSWGRIERLAMQLAEKIEASGFKPEILVGIAIGGLVPLALLARELDVRNVVTVTARSYDNKTKLQGEIVISHMPEVHLRGKRVLLVDEMADSGGTLKVISGILTSRYEVDELKIATLVVNKENCTFPPDFSVLSVDRWVNFPWEESIV